uniref:Uncharacterized protein n=1 Tax=Arundo donax TaxID=35708 RepID=A0A0A8YT87_ARUDO
MAASHQVTIGQATSQIIGGWVTVKTDLMPASHVPWHRAMVQQWLSTVDGPSIAGQ